MNHEKNCGYPDHNCDCVFEKKNVLPQEQWYRWYISKCKNYWWKVYNVFVAMIDDK